MESFVKNCMVVIVFLVWGAACLLVGIVWGYSSAERKLHDSYKKVMLEEGSKAELQFYRSSWEGEEYRR